MNQRFLTLSECASLCRVSEWTIREWSKIGKFPAPLRIGRALRFNAAEVECFLAAEPATNER